MNRGARAILLILGLGALVVVMFAGMGWWWWTNHGTQFQSDAVVGMKQGEEFGNGALDQQCLNEAFDRNRAHPETDSGFVNLMFLTGCLIESEHSPEFCKGVPSEWNAFAAANWTEARCASEGLDSASCAGMLNAVVTHCGGVEKP